MTGLASIAALIVVLAGAADAPASGEAPAAAAPAAPRDEGPFLGPRFRWAEMPVLPRVGYDIIAIPANMPRWSASDWAQLATWTGAIVILMVPLEDPLDARLDRWITVHVNPHFPTIWTDTMQPILWTSIAVTGLTTWGWAALAGRDDVKQGCSLMGEALAVSQAYHLTFKLLIGREGPQNGEGKGAILGPFQTVKYYPAGTPSGHAATLTSLLSVADAYFRPPLWISVPAYVLVGGVILAHVVDHRHFLSDSLWGAAMGWYVGRWVVRHRASPLPAERKPALQLSALPIPLRGGAGLAVRAVF